MLQNVFSVLCILLISSSIQSQTKKEQKQLEKENQYQFNISLVESEQFIFKPISTTAQNGRIIDLLNNSGLLTINGKTAEANLPYFGVVQMPSRIGNEGIVFNSENTTYKIEKNDKKRKVILSFSAKNKSEIFNLRLTISGNNNADLNVTSSKRNSISYYGKVSKLEE